MRNPIGFSVAVILELLIVVNVQFLATCVVIVAIGTSLTIISITEDMKRSLHALNKCAKKKKIHFKMTQKINEFIELHANAKQLSD